MGILNSPFPPPSTVNLPGVWAPRLPYFPISNFYFSGKAKPKKLAGGKAFESGGAPTGLVGGIGLLDLLMCDSARCQARFGIILANEAPILVVPPRRLFPCGKTVGVFGWSTARTIGSTFGRIYFSDTESRLPRRTPSPLVPLSIAVLGPDAISVAKSICIGPLKYSDSSKTLLNPSLHIRYFAMKEPAASPSTSLDGGSEFLWCRHCYLDNGQSRTVFAKLVEGERPTFDPLKTCHWNILFKKI